MTRKDEYNVMRRELETYPLPVQAVDARLRRVYAELPDALPVKRRMPVWVKRGLCTAASLLAACGLLLGVNSVDPALAESLPFVGSIFQSINDAGYMPAENRDAARSRLAGYAVDMSGEEGSTVTVPAGGMLEKPVLASLKEVYYDGSFVFAGLEFQFDGDHGRVTETAGPGYDITINGEAQVRHEDGRVAYPRGTGNGFCDMSDYFLTKLGRDQYAMQRAFRVPDAFQGADALEIELSFDGLSGEGFSPICSTGFTLSFTAHKTEVPTRVVDCSGIEQNGVRLVAATASPVVTYLAVEYPETYNNPACGASFDDGLFIGGLGGGTRLPEGGMVRETETYAGLREEESRNVVWRLFDKNGSYKEEAIFVIDFANGSARVGTTADLKKPPVGDYACGADAIRDLTEGYIVEKYHADQSKPMLYLASGGGKKEDLHVEVWQGGELVDSAQARRGDNTWFDGLYWEYGADEDRLPGTEHTSCLMLLPNGYVGLDLTQPLTVRAYNSAGKLVLEQEITLTISG